MGLCFIGEWRILPIVFGMEKKYMFKKIINFLMLYFVMANIAYATNIGVAAENLVGPLDAFSGLVYKICYVVGVVLVVGGLVQFKKHRDNPSEVPLSRAVILLILGVVVGLLPLIPHWLVTTTGVKYAPLTPNF